MSENVNTNYLRVSKSKSLKLPQSMSKDNGENMTSNNRIRDEVSTKEGNKYSLGAQRCSTEAELSAVDFSGRFSVSEASSSKDEQTGAKRVTSDCVMEPFENPNGIEHRKYKSPIRNIQNFQNPGLQSHTIQANGTDDLVDVRVCDICGDVGREALLALCSNCSDGAEHIYCMRVKMDAVPDGDWMCEECMVMQEHKRQKQAVGERSDHPSKPSHLKEVNVAPAKKNPGIQCAGEMRIERSVKASCLSGKRPGSDLEEGRVPKRRILEGSTEGLKSPRKMLLSQVSSVNPKKMEICETRRLSSFSGQSAKVKPEARSGALEKSVQLSKSGSGGKVMLARVSSLKIKGKETARPVPSVGHSSPKQVAEKQYSPQGHQSPRPQQKFRIGKLYKSKSMKIPDSIKEVQWLSNGIRPDGSSKETADRPSNKKVPERKLLKSLSFGANSVPRKESDVPFSDAKKDLNYRSGKISAAKYDSPRERTRKSGLQFSASDGMKVETKRTKVFSENTSHPSKNKVQDMKAIQANGDSNAKPCEPAALLGKNCADVSVVRSTGETVPVSNPSGGIRSSVENVDSYRDQKAKQSPQKSEVECGSGADMEHRVASDKTLPFNLHPIKEMPTFTPSDVVSAEISAFPESEFIWKGGFKLEKSSKLPNECGGIQAHLSTCASSKVVDLVHKFHPKLLLKEVPRVRTWPVQFQRKLPTEQDIAVYFFAEDLDSYSRGYKMVLEGMVKNDLALEADFDGVQLLVFPSSLLPIRSQRWNALSFLWGVFRVKKVDNSVVHSPSVNVAGLNQVPGSLDLIVSQSLASALPTSGDPSFEMDVTRLQKCVDSEETETLHCKANVVPPAADLTDKERLSGCVQSHALDEKEDTPPNQDTKCLSKPCTPPEQPDGENMIYLAVDPDVDHHKGSTDLTWQEEKKPEVASGSSISVDSGPSGSSDGGGCAKPDDGGQVEQCDLNLDLSLHSGTGSERPRAVVGFDLNLDLNLDLELGFPPTNNDNYQPKNIPKDTNKKKHTEGGKSLFLSLGISC